MRLLWASLHGGPRVMRTHAESVRQHVEILDALRAGDAAAAASLTHWHIMGVEHLPGVRRPLSRPWHRDPRARAHHEGCLEPP